MTDTMRATTQWAREYISGWDRTDIERVSRDLRLSDTERSDLAARVGAGDLEHEDVIVEAAGDYVRDNA